MLLMCVGLSGSAQVKTAASGKIDQRIVEVYGTMADQLVSNDKDRLKMLNDLLQQRTSLVQKPIDGTEKLPKISTIPLFNKYNPGLKRDATGAAFDPQQFNVLKYKIPFTAINTRLYRIDGTNYILVVKPQIIGKS